MAFWDFLKDILKPKQPSPIIDKPPVDDGTVTLKKKIQDEIIFMASAWIGVRETKGNNRSPQIDALIQSQGGSLGSPYCMYGVQHVVQSACLKLNLQNPMPEGGSTQRVWAKINEKYKSKNPTRASLIFWRSRKDKSRGHVGIVEDFDGDLVTIEFNTNDAGSRDGDGVWRKRRKLSGSISLELLGFVNIAQMIIDKNSPEKIIKG
jgi:hypothetical protein